MGDTTSTAGAARIAAAVSLLLQASTQLRAAGEAAAAQNVTCALQHASAARDFTDRARATWITWADDAPVSAAIRASAQASFTDMIGALDLLEAGMRDLDETLVLESTALFHRGVSRFSTTLD